MKELERVLEGRSKGKGKERESRSGSGREGGGGGSHDDGKYRTKDGKHLNFWAEEELVGVSALFLLVRFPPWLWLDELISIRFVHSPQPPKPIAPPPPPLSQEETQKLEPHTMFLSRTERELKPWYVDKELKRFDERGEPKDEREREKREKQK